MSRRILDIELSNTGISGAVYVKDKAEYEGPFSAVQILTATASFTKFESNWEGPTVVKLPAGVFCGIFDKIQLSDGEVILYRLGGDVIDGLS